MIEEYKKLWWVKGSVGKIQTQPIMGGKRIFVRETNKNE